MVETKENAVWRIQEDNLVKQALADRTVYITGAGSGIGRATAILLAQQGAKVVAVDLNLEAAEAVKADIERAGGVCRADCLDVTDAKATAALIASLAVDGWDPDIVINNAGMGYIASFFDTEPDEWRKTFDVNVVGVIIGCREFAKRWRDAKKGGHLINIASMASVTPVPSLIAYSSSKYAVEGLCEVLALELPDCDVTCIHPGFINTPIVRNPALIKLPESQIEKIQDHYVTNGDSPDVVAQAIFKSILNKPSNVYVGRGSAGVPMLKRLLPRSWFREILKKQAKQFGFLAD